MDILLAIGKFLIEHFDTGRSSMFDEMSEQIKERFRRTLLLSLSAMICGLLVVGGVFLFVLGLSGSYIEYGAWVGDPRVVTGAGLAIVSVIGMAISLSARLWHGNEVQRRPSASEALQQAVALFLTEYMRDRERHREDQKDWQRPHVI